MNLTKKLISSIESKEARVGIVGLGYVGLPLLLRFQKKKFPVIGFDNNLNFISQLNDGISPINHISNKKIQEFNKDNTSKVTSDVSQVSECDVLIICLPTPLDDNDKPDLSYIKNFLHSVSKFLKRGQLLSLESTTYPGTTEEVIVPFIKELGFQVGKDFFIAYSPEREDPGNPHFSTGTIPKLCSGSSLACMEIAKELYQSVIDEVVLVESTKVAEMAKLLENTYRAVNVGLINEMRIIASALEIDIYEVIKAASTKPFGFTPYFPGPGLGGHCLPIDPIYLSWKAQQVGVKSDFIDLAAQINRSVPDQVVHKLEKTFDEKNQELNGKKVLVLGLAYKKNIDDARESPSYEILDILKKKGAKIDYSDPYIEVFPETRRYNFDIKSIVLNERNLELYDAVILATDHDDFDLDLIQRKSKILIDTRGVCDKTLNNVVRL